MPLRSLPGLQPTRQEKTSSFLGALLFVCGSLTLLMFIAWLSQRGESAPLVAQVSIDTSPGEPASGADGNPETVASDQAAAEEQPQVVSEAAAELLTSVSPLVTKELAELDGLGSGDQRESGRNIGPPGPAGGIVPPWERWQIRFTATDLQEYARELDALGVELGVIGGGLPQVDYAKGFALPRPLVRQGTPAAETRLRFVYRSGPLKEADRSLTEKAGIRTEGRIVCQFYSSSVQSQLAALEQAPLGGQPLSAVRRTIFGIRKEGKSCKFVVERVEFSRRPSGLAPL